MAPGLRPNRQLGFHAARAVRVHLTDSRRSGQNPPSARYLLSSPYLRAHDAPDARLIPHSELWLEEAGVVPKLAGGFAMKASLLRLMLRSITGPEISTEWGPSPSVPQTSSELH